MEEQKINKKITIGVVAVLLIVLITIGATYAYFSAQAETGTQTVTTGTLTMGFDKIGSVVTINGIIPINDSEIKTKAAAFPFSITNTGAQHTNITIKLKDIAIADDLKDIDFRWGLYNTDTGNGVSFGIFKYSTNGGEEILLRDVIIDSTDPDSTKNYTLRIWIHDDGANQNYMQGETFSGKIEVTGETVDYTSESCFEFDASTGAITGYDFLYDESGNLLVMERGIPARAGNCPKDVIIPKTIKGTTVTKIIGPGSFDDEYGVFGDTSNPIKSIVIPDTVTTLGTGSLKLSGIQNVTIPESVTTVGRFAFGDLTLNNFFIPETTSSWDFVPFNGAFGNTSISTKTLIIPGVKVATEGIVPGNVENLILMEGLTEIESDAFHNIYNTLTSIEIPSSVTTIGTKIFLNPYTSSTNVTEIVVRGKTSAPAGFAAGWNCKSADDISGVCLEYIPVTYRP